eukprot:scaffold13011_cov129-Isochrysis_galbana.AAC.3
MPLPRPGRPAAPRRSRRRRRPAVSSEWVRDWVGSWGRLTQWSRAGPYLWDHILGVIRVGAGHSAHSLGVHAPCSERRGRQRLQVMLWAIHKRSGLRVRV